MPDEIPNERKAPRIAVLGHAVVTGPNLRANCIIRDLSSTGAKLGISGKVKLPAGFDLWLLKTRSERRVVLRWRRGELRRSGVLPKNGRHDDGRCERRRRGHRDRMSYFGAARLSVIGSPP